MASKQLATNGAEHNKHETEEQCDVDHYGNRLHDGRHELTHVWDLIDGSQWTQDPDNLNGGDVATFHKQTEPTE